MNNRYEIINDRAVIFINHKGVEIETYINADDLSIAQSYKGAWYLNGGYVTGTVRVTPGRKGKRKTIRLHRLIVNPPEDMEVDHKNRVKTDNRRCNLRVVTTAENLQNKSVYKNSKSGVTGVRQKPNGRWQAYKYLNGKQMHLGYYDTKEEASQAQG